MAFVALLDANVLYPQYLRDIYLRLCQAGLFQVRWSEEILNEMSRNAKEQVGPDRAHQIDRTIAMMKHHFRDAMVTGYEHLIPSMTNNEKDQHVLAAAIVGRADVIVTNNVRHFPEASCAPYNIDVQKADQFLCYQWDVEDPDDVVAVLEHWAARLDSPPYTLPDLLEKVLSKQVPNFSQTVLDYLDASQAGAPTESVGNPDISARESCTEMRTLMRQASHATTRTPHRTQPEISLRWQGNSREKVK